MRSGLDKLFQPLVEQPACHQLLTAYEGLRRASLRVCTVQGDQTRLTACIARSDGSNEPRVPLVSKALAGCRLYRGRQACWRMSSGCVSIVIPCKPSLQRGNTSWLHVQNGCMTSVKLQHTLERFCCKWSSIAVHCKASCLHSARHALQREVCF